MTEWYRIHADEALKELAVNPNTGLTEAEVEKRRAEYGWNELVERGQKRWWQILLDQFTGILIVILLVAAAISFVLGDLKDGIAIMAIVILNAALGYTQEYRAEKAIAALKKMAVPTVRVRRDGHVRELSARELVPGDIVLLEAGNSIPADGRIIESINLRVQEAVLTGESEPVEKTIEPILEPNPPLGDRRNLAYMGTIVPYGRGTVLVTGTGMQTELGRIANLLQDVKVEKTPLQRRLEQLGRGLALAALVIVALVFVLGVLRGEDLRLMVLTAISMAVAAVPEGLPAVVTIALALGAQRMLQRRALIRKLPAVETLGSVTVICSDKTGTLTENRMTVTVIDIAGHRLDLSENLRFFSPTLHPDSEPETALQSQPGTIPLLLACGALANDAILEQSNEDADSYITVGDPTEGALVVAAARAGIWKDRLEKIVPRVGEVPFESERKRMTTVHRLPDDDFPEPLQALCRFLEIHEGDEKYLAVTKGAVDSLLQISDQVWTGELTEDLDDAWSQRINESNEILAKNGMRVLGIAFRPLIEYAASNGQNPVEDRLIFVGLVGMIDPARPEVKEAVRTCKEAGIRPIMITGDHPLTALAIGRELGFTRDNRVISGRDLSEMSVDELKQHIDSVSVYARVSPEHKLMIVDALQDLHHVVAMTGDGVNDAPALKRADIGIAMGITGTDVSKEASDMVLLDDNFATIVAAVEEGRRIYDNIRKFIKYTMTSNAGEIWVVLLAPFLGMPLPLLPLQILWVNLVTDGLPGLGLTVEPTEPDTMRRPPYSTRENIFARGMGVDVLWVGLLMGLVSLGMGYYVWISGSPTWQTMVFTTLTLSQMGNVLAIRTERQSLFKVGLFSNRAILGAVLLTFLLQMAVVYVPFLQGIFNTIPLPLPDLAVSLVMSTVVFFGVEVKKWFVRRADH